jgi:hypothetical protein
MVVPWYATEENGSLEVTSMADIPAATGLGSVPLKAHEQLGGALWRSGGGCEQVLADFGKAGIDLGKLAEDLQSQGARSFDGSWQKLLNAIRTKSKTLQEVG